MCNAFVCDLFFQKPIARDTSGQEGMPAQGHLQLDAGHFFKDNSQGEVHSLCTEYSRQEADLISSIYLVNREM